MYPISQCKSTDVNSSLILSHFLPVVGLESFTNSSHYNIRFFHLDWRTVSLIIFRKAIIELLWISNKFPILTYNDTIIISLGTKWPVTKSFKIYQGFESHPHTCTKTCQEVSRCHIRGESDESITCRWWSTQVRDPPWLLNPEQTSPEVQNRCISCST